MAAIEAYFDESYGDDGVLAVSGYAFTKRRRERFDAAWRRMLVSNGRNLPFFRMSSCVHHRAPFDRISRDECDVVAREAIALIGSYAAVGISLTINEDDYNAKHKKTTQQAYDLCLTLAMAYLRKWANEGNRQGRIAYYFEQGHKHQKRGHRLMTDALSTPLLRSAYRYESHEFAPKEKYGGCQAADMLAWHTYTPHKREKRGQPMRRDLKALLGSTLYLRKDLPSQEWAMITHDLMGYLGTNWPDV